MDQQPKTTSTLSTVVKTGLLLLIPIAIIAVLAIGIPRYYYSISDWWFLRSYQPTEEIENLATEAKLSQKGRNIFYVHDPKIEKKEDFNKDCPFKERTYVIGCYDGSRIFILDIEEDRLDKTESVTVAHEMLHAAYHRLSATERKRIDSLLSDALKDADQRVVDLIEEYRKADPSAVPSELHSIVGTEINDLNAELEEYYSQYFTDRKAVVKSFNEYEKVFSDLRDQADGLQADLDQLRQEKKDLEQKLKSQQAKLNDYDKRLDKLENDNNIDDYNALVPERNALADEYNANITELQSVIETHNAKVKQKNSIATEINDLLFSIDSKKFEKL